jgi:hypothetical protein
MQFRIHAGLALAALPLFALTCLSQVKTSSGPGTGTFSGPPRLVDLTAQAHTVVVGKVVDVDKDSVEATPFRGAAKDQMTTYKIATVKIEEPLIGGRGLTQFRVGFPADGNRFRPLPVGGPNELTLDLEGCYFLMPHHEGNFYILSSAMLEKKDKDYGKKLDEVKKVAKAIDDPVTALKAKTLDERFQAAQIILQRYQMNRSGRPAAREPIPDEENKLILALLAELPWLPKGASAKAGMVTTVGTGIVVAAPSRIALWHLINAHESGYKPPPYPPRKAGDPPIDYNKIQDEATAAFLKNNLDKIKIKRFVR